MDNAVVCGYGYVGKATALAFNIKDYYTRHERTLSLEEVTEKDYIFICLPTPTINGKAFTDDIEELIKKLSKDSIIVIRSTVPPGFCQQMQEKYHLDNIVFYPEFLSEKTWEKDAIQPMMVVLGGDNLRSREKVLGLIKGRYKYSDTIITDTITAECIKHTMNSWFTTKVVFCNHIFNYAQEVKANYETIRRALESHPWGMKHHTEIWHKGGRGAGGHCLAKDVEAFVGITNSDFLRVVMQENEGLLLNFPKEE